jgi:hypothetical protein
MSDHKKTADPGTPAPGPRVSATIHVVDHARIEKGKLRLRVREVTIQDGVITKVDDPTWRDD